MRAEFRCLLFAEVEGRAIDRHFVLDSTARLFVLLVNLVFAGIASYVFNRVHAVPELRVEALAKEFSGKESLTCLQTLVSGK